MPDYEQFTYSMLIREHHLDSFGHVNNATYLEILEDARWEFITARGFGLERIQTLKLGPVVLELDIKFLKELRLRQRIVVKSQAISHEKKTGVLRQDIFNEQNEPCCHAIMKFGLFDMTARKLTIPTAEWFYAVGIQAEPSNHNLK